MTIDTATETADSGANGTGANGKNGQKRFEHVALVASDTPRAQEAFSMFWAQRDWAPLEEADAAIVLGGDGFMLQTLHAMLDSGRTVPVYGVNRGTVGFLMNRYD